MKEIARLSALERLALDGSDIGDAALTDLARLPALRALNLNSTDIGDVGLRTLGGMTQLRDLRLSYGRFTDKGLAALTPLYFGRTAGMDRRADDFEYIPHIRQATPKSVFADIAASRAKLETETKARRVFVLGFCFGGRIAFLSSAEQPGLAGVVGFYGRLGKRENEVWPVPAEQAARTRAPVLGLFGGDDPSIPPSDIAAFDTALATAKVKHHLETYPGAPHSFFDRTFGEHRKECDDAWRQVLGFMKTGDAAKTA